MNKKPTRPMTESEKQARPMDNELDPGKDQTKIFVAANKAAIKYTPKTNKDK